MTTFTRVLENPRALQSLGLPPLNAQPKHSAHNSWGSSHPRGTSSPPLKASACPRRGLQPHQGVPVGPAEVVLHSSVTEADPLVVLRVAWKSQRGRQEWVMVPLHLVGSVPLPSQLSVALEPPGHSAPSQSLPPDVLFSPCIVLVHFPPHSTWSRPRWHGSLRFLQHVNTL